MLKFARVRCIVPERFQRPKRARNCFRCCNVHCKFFVFLESVALQLDIEEVAEQIALQSESEVANLENSLEFRST